METMNKETDEEEIRKIKEKREKFIRESRVIAFGSKLFGKLRMEVGASEREA